MREPPPPPVAFGHGCYGIVGATSTTLACLGGPPEWSSVEGGDSSPELEFGSGAPLDVDGFIVSGVNGDFRVSGGRYMEDGGGP